MKEQTQSCMPALPGLASGPGGRARGFLLVALAALALLAAGCTSRPLTNVPVENRGTSAAGTPAGPAVAEPVDVKSLPGAENAGKPGYYSVRPGDTMIRIGLDTGQNWRDIVRWNNLENPNLIEVGQVLRVIPPVPATASASPAGSASAGVSDNPLVVTRPVTPGGSVAAAPILPASAASRPSSSPTAAASVPSSPAAPASAAPPVAAAPPAPAPVPSGDENVGWIWPAQGALLAGFDEARNKGLDIAGKPGDPVLASADGRVVYAGAGLRGYGNLVILKHNNTFLTAYAHNQTLLVKEDQSVKKGQKIAEMGSSDADRVKLHFEIRRQGRPVDPARYLPPR
jgi:lipoprotein NlpD